jgi:hypothetical protein
MRWRRSENLVCNPTQVFLTLLYRNSLSIKASGLSTALKWPMNVSCCAKRNCPPSAINSKVSFQD